MAPRGRVPVALLAMALSLRSAAAQSGAPPRPAVRTGPQCQTWYDTTPRASNATYRNVMWYGAKGDGVTDDTAAFNSALTYNRSPLFTLTDPMVVYVPPGDYVISNTLTLWFYTALIGNYKCPPRLLVPAGTWPGGQTFLLSGDTSYSGDHDDEFYRQIAHIDIVFGANNGGGGGLHWAVSQATFLRDMVIDGSAGANIGIFDENGSGGFASDLTIIGFKNGLSVGNQVRPSVDARGEEGSAREESARLTSSAPAWPRPPISPPPSPPPFSNPSSFCSSGRGSTSTSLARRRTASTRSGTGCRSSRASRSPTAPSACPSAATQTAPSRCSTRRRRTCRSSSRLTARCTSSSSASRR